MSCGTASSPTPCTCLYTSMASSIMLVLESIARRCRSMDASEYMPVSRRNSSRWKIRCTSRYDESLGKRSNEREGSEETSEPERGAPSDMTADAEQEEGCASFLVAA